MIGNRNRLYCFFITLWLCFWGVYCSPKKTRMAEEILQNLDLDRKIGQMVMVGVSGSAISDASRSMIESCLPGGIILFGYNLSSTEQTVEFISEMQRESVAASGIPLFISIDQEGGRVKRITGGVTQFPGNMAMGSSGDEELAYNAARILGIQLRRYGINMNLAPVLDVNNNPDNPVINIRSFGASPGLVASMGASYIKGLQRSRCIAVGKHFPGHGDTNRDSHITLPVISHGIERLEKVELRPFEAAIDADVECIMSAHIAYPVLLGDNTPATLSEKILTGLLRERMKFGGLVITDDMEMAAVSEQMDIGDAAVASVKAGSDIVLISTNGENVAKITGSLKEAARKGVLSAERINSSVIRILELKLRYEIMRVVKSGLVLAEPRYGPEELKLLDRAGEVDMEISRGSIRLYGRATLPSGPVKILFTQDEALRQEVREHGNSSTLIASTEKELFALIGKHGAAEPIVYCHVDKVFNSHAALIKSLSRLDKVRLMVLSTDNPFPLLRLEPLPPLLLTFSNTGESMRQAVRCINGEFVPRTGRDLRQGIR